MDFVHFISTEDPSYISAFLQQAEEAEFFCFDYTKSFVTLILYKEHPKVPKELDDAVVIWPDGYLSALDSSKTNEFSIEWCAENVFPMSDPLWEEIKLILEMALV